MAECIRSPDLIRKRQPKRQSPIKSPSLPLPGDSLRREILDVLSRGATWAIVAIAVFFQAAMEWYRWYWGLPPMPLTYTVLAAVAIVAAIIMWRRSSIEADRLQLGRSGEISVAQLLEKLGGDGFRIFHDISEESYNIDHVIIGPPGVFVIETKTLSLPDDRKNEIKFDGQRIWINGMLPDRDPIQQVRACTDRVGEVLTRASGRSAPMHSVVLYPGWWVDPQPKGVDVWVLNPKALSAFLRHEPTRLSESDVALFASALETYLRAKAVTA